MNAEHDVRDNPPAQRFELVTDAGTAYVSYRVRDGIVMLDHTEVPAALRGRGIGTVLVGARSRSSADAGRKSSPTVLSPRATSRNTQSIARCWRNRNGRYRATAAHSIAAMSSFFICRMAAIARRARSEV
ncbi:MAG: GNAT family N-acetyltransferase [Gammaproteobacteria bacterium]